MLEMSIKRSRLLSNVGKALGCPLFLGWLAVPAEAGWPFGDETGKPDRVIALWTDTVLTRGGTPPVRGFGGRLMFYEGKKESPCKVDGVLVVYAFDENGRDANMPAPTENTSSRRNSFPPITASRSSGIRTAYGSLGMKSVECRRTSR